MVAAGTLCPARAQRTIAHFYAFHGAGIGTEENAAEQAVEPQRHFGKIGTDRQSVCLPPCTANRSAQIHLLGLTITFRGYRVTGVVR